MSNGSEGMEVTLEQFFRSKWFGYLWKSAVSAGSLGVTVLCIVITIVTTNTNSTAQTAALVASEAKISVEQIRIVQAERALTADLRAETDEEWRQRFDAGLVRVNQRVSSLSGDIASIKEGVGELKGILIRQENEAKFGSPFVGDAGSLVPDLGDIVVPR
jgi:hypothetical protein